jgi:hypothetical protein
MNWSQLTPTKSRRLAGLVITKPWLNGWRKTVFEISTIVTVNGKPIKIRADLHQVRLPGSNVLATKLPQPDLYRALKEANVPGVLPSHGWQQLCLQLAAYQQDLSEAADE